MSQNSAIARFFPCFTCCCSDSSDSEVADSELRALRQVDDMPHQTSGKVLGGYQQFLEDFPSNKDKLNFDISEIELSVPHPPSYDEATSS